VVLALLCVLLVVVGQVVCDSSAEPVFDSTIERRGEQPSVVTPTGPKQYATLYSFPPDLCHMRDHKPVYDFINTEATYYHDLDVIYVSMDGDPPVIRFFNDKSKQTASTIDAESMSIEQLTAIIKQQTTRVKNGEPTVAEEDKGVEVNIKSMSVEQITQLLTEHNVQRGFARPDWKPPSTEPSTAPGFEVPAEFVPSGEPEVPLEEIDDSIVRGTDAKKKALAEERAAKAAAEIEAARAAKAAAATATAAAAAAAAATATATAA